MRAGNPRAIAVSAVAALLLAGCAAQDGSAPAGSALPSDVATAPPDGRADGASSELIDAAQLAACPVTDPSVAPVPDGLPDITLPCLGDGPDVRLAGLRGMPYVVNVWASWCGPCRAELPLMGEVYRANKSAVGFLGIDMADDQSAALELAAATQMSFPSAQDPTSQIRAGLSVVGVPVTVFVRSDGTIAGRANVIASADELNSLIERYLGVTTK